MRSGARRDGTRAGQVRARVTALREAVVIARGVGALEDELEVRIGLAGALVERGDPVGRDEAENTSRSPVTPRSSTASTVCTWRPL